MPRIEGLLLALLTLNACPGPKEAGQGAAVQQQPRPPRQSLEVPFELVASELTRFRAPVRVGAMPQGPSYREALVFRLRVNREQYDGLPPDIAPFLYVDGYELRPFAIERPERGKDLILAFHAPAWQRIPDSALMVLTAEHGAPIRDPQRFQRAVRFRKSAIVDRR
jgi:hypothetical protein